MSVMAHEKAISLDDGDRKALIEALSLMSSQFRADADSLANSDDPHITRRAVGVLRAEFEEGAANAERLSVLIEDADEIILTRS